MGKSLDPKKIKSAQRVLEVLEFFDRERQECTVMDIAREYGYPQSSTSELLSCLVALGYLRRDMWSRTYKPTARAAMLGAWVQPRRFRHGLIASMMDELAEETGASILLASRIGVDVQVAHSVLRDGTGDSFKAGVSLLLLHSAPGKVLLSTNCITNTKKIVHRINAECDEEQRVKADEFLQELKTVRTQGYAVSFHEDGWGMISIQLPSSAEEESLALTVVVAAEELDGRLDDIVQVLRGAIARAFGTRDKSFEGKSAVGLMGRAV